MLGSLFLAYLDVRLISGDIHEQIWYILMSWKRLVQTLGGHAQNQGVRLVRSLMNPLMSPLGHEAIISTVGKMRALESHS